jgi:hypothetical protein
MSDTGLYFVMQSSLSSQKLSAFYDFIYDSSENNVEGHSANFTGIQTNSIFCNDPSLHTGFILGALGSNESETSYDVSEILEGDKLDLTSGNFKVPLDGLNANNISVIIDFEFEGAIDDGVLLGCFKKRKENIEFNSFENSEGFNIGVTDRGHLFCQTYGPNGDSIDVITSIELSKRNVIGLSVSESSLSLGTFDYFNNIVRSVEIPVYGDYIHQTEFLYFGGSDNYFRSESHLDATFSGSLHNLALFSGSMDTRVLKQISEGILGDYFYNERVESQSQRITGYSEAIVYKTGVTGYEYNSTGSLTIATGREYFTGSFSENSFEAKEEGERFYKYYTLNNGDTETFYKEEIGQLHSESGYIYYPTGEGAYDTLGLNDISESIQTYIETTGIEQGSTTINLYGRDALTGTLNEVSGVETVPLYETVSSFSPASSGVTLGYESEDFKKNFIYYMGTRNEF